MSTWPTVVGCRSWALAGRKNLPKTGKFGLAQNHMDLLSKSHQIGHFLAKRGRLQILGSGRPVWGGFRDFGFFGSLVLPSLLHIRIPIVFQNQCFGNFLLLWKLRSHRVPRVSCTFCILSYIYYRIPIVNQNQCFWELLILWRGWKIWCLWRVWWNLGLILVSYRNPIVNV